MEIREPEFRCGANWQELADLFGYEIGIHDQDWTYTIVEPHRIDEYIEAYDTHVTNDDSKFSLMEMIIQTLADLKNENLRNEKWEKIFPILNRDFDLHQYTVYYWCCWDNDDINDWWNITPLMRKFWVEK